MNKEKAIGVNAVLNVVRQLLTVLFPIITIPYAVRTIGVENLGKVNYGHSIIVYFSLLAMLGFTKYAVREGSKKRENKREFSTFANEIFTLNFVSTILAYCLFFVCLFCIPKIRDYKKLLLLQSISIILTTVGVDWINTIYEDFLIITIRSIFTYLLSIIILFCFVKSPEDYYIYASLVVITNGVICISNLFYCRKYTHLHLTRHTNYKEHLKPTLVFFVSAVAVSIYVNIDTTMLGWIKGDYAVGIYSLAVKVYVAVKSVMTAIYNVSIPRLSFFAGGNYKQDFNCLLTNLFGYITVLLIPATIGLIIISDDVLVLLGGVDYLQAVSTLRVLAIALLFAIYGGLICDCLNVAIGREKDNLIATIYAAIINFTLNLFLITYYSYLGAAITTLIAEVFVTVYCCLKNPRIIDYFCLKCIIKTILHSLFGSILMIGCSVLLKRNVSSISLRVSCIILISIIVYLAFMIIIKDSFILNLKKTVIRKLKSHRK